MSRPSVSVIMPVYDCARYVGHALCSVRSQHYPTLEMIVVDDGSGDGSADVAREHGALVLQGEHRGIAHARNRGVATATGELVAFLDSDDLWTEGSLAARVAYLEEHPAVDFVFGHIRDFVQTDDPPPQWVPLPRRETQVQMGSTFLGRRMLMSSIGPFDETLAIGEDLDWIARAYDGGATGHCLEGVYAHRRLHSGNATARHATSGREALRRVVRDSVRRKRTAAP